MCERSTTSWTDTGMMRMQNQASITVLKLVTFVPQGLLAVVLCNVEIDEVVGQDQENMHHRWGSPLLMRNQGSFIVIIQNDPFTFVVKKKDSLKKRNGPLLQ